MGLVINGVTIPDNIANAIEVNNINITEVILNGTSYWKQNLYSGPTSGYAITASKTLTAGIDFPADTDIDVCLCGGGGSGAQYSTNFAGGGHAGTIVNSTFRKAVGETISVVIGAGAPSGVSSGGYNGSSGGTTSIGTITAPGGGGGTYGTGSAHYMGNGAAKTSCGGTFNDGVRGTYGSWVAGGGEAGAFGSGGQGGNNTVACKAGGIGAGGGASTNNSPAGYSHAGGRGQVVLSW